MKHVLLAAVALLVGACASPTSAVKRPQPEAERAALVAVNKAFAAATAEQGLQGWMEYFGEQSTIFPPGVPITTGSDAIRSHYLATGFDPRELRWEPEGAEVAASGELGYTWGTWSLDRHNQEGQP